MTITLYGPIEDCRRVEAILRAVPELDIGPARVPIAVADGTGRYRVSLTVEV